MPAFCTFAAEIAVNREGPAFRISGPVAVGDVHVYTGDGDVPPVMGSYVTEGSDVVFHPRFEIPRNVACRVVVKGREFRFPAEKVELNRSTVVERVYPTADEIPANQLKFYIQFSAPMHVGDAWKNLRLLDEKGSTVDLAFLEIDQELWDRDGRRLTVLFDPGRIKRGVLPRDQVGAALESGKQYTLVVGPGWRDGHGAPLKVEFRKRFRAGAEDRTAIDPNTWKLTIPRANTRDALVVSFGEPLDAALAMRLITVQGVPGEAALGAGEREWRFVPADPWTAGESGLEVDTALEDLAGNRVGRQFDVDTFERITARPGRGMVRIPFRVNP